MTDHCTDKRMATLRHHYELGLLSGEELREFEMHLYECDDCFARVQQFEPAARLMRHDQDVRRAVQRMSEVGPEDASAAETPEHAAFRRPWRKIIPVVLTAAAALVILILKPWHVEFQPTREAVARENLLAVMYFDNVVQPDDPRKLAEIATNLLITDLSESSYFQVVSGQRLYDILKLLGKEGQTAVDRAVAQELADTVGADQMILGNILQVEPFFILTAQLFEVSSGKIIAAQKVSGSPGEDIFSIVDRLSAQIKGDLPLPAAAREERDPRIAEVTTHSAEAYRAYLEGLNYQRKYFLTEAAAAFSRAVEFDSTFAMAYYYLAGFIDGKLITNAIEHLDRAGRRDQYYIRSRSAVYARDMKAAVAELEALLGRYPDEKDAFYLLATFAETERRHDQAVRYLQEALRIDPLYTSAYNYLAYVYSNMDEYERAIEAINTYISLVPDEPNPYDTRGEIFLNNGRVDQAVESFRLALQKKPDFYNSLWNLAHIHFLRQEYAAAESLYQACAAHNDDIALRVRGRLYSALIPLGQGRFEQSLAALDQVLALDSAEGLTGRYLEFGHFIKARIYAELREYGPAIAEFQKHMEDFAVAHPDNKIYDRNMYVQLLAESGDLAQARQVVQTLKHDLEQSGQSLATYYYAAGCVELADGNPDSAITCFRMAVEGWADYPARYMLAQAHWEAGRLAEAVDKFESLQRDYSQWRVFWCIWSAKAHYTLGLAYEQSMWFAQAIEQYETFLAVWKDADPGIPEIDDARARLARLNAGS